ncbi:glycine cleavage system protein GcvH [Microcoleus sp. AT9_B5]
MAQYPEDLKYLDSHEYIRLEGDTATIGITEFAANQLGEIVFVELPEVGKKLETGEPFGSIESVKAVETLYAPVTGTVVERNEGLVDSPEDVSDDPYGDGWLVKMRVDNPSELDDAMSAEKYRALVAEAE